MIEVLVIVLWIIERLASIGYRSLYGIQGVRWQVHSLNRRITWPGAN